MIARRRFLAALPVLALACAPRVKAEEPTPDQPTEPMGWWRCDTHGTTEYGGQADLRWCSACEREVLHSLTGPMRWEASA